MSKLLITGGTGSFGKAFLKRQLNNKSLVKLEFFHVMKNRMI